MKPQSLLILFVIVVMLTLLGAVLIGSLRHSPEDTARAFMEAMNKADEPAVRATLTKTANQKMEKPLELKADHAMEYTIGQGTVTQNTAQVPVAIKQEDGKEETLHFRLRQEEGQWRIYAMTVPTDPNGTEITLDFEHPETYYGEVFKSLGDSLGAMLQGMGDGLGAMLKGIGDGLQKMNRTTPATH